MFFQKFCPKQWFPYICHIFLKCLKISSFWKNLRKTLKHFLKEYIFAKYFPKASQTDGARIPLRKILATLDCSCDCERGCVCDWCYFRFQPLTARQDRANAQAAMTAQSKMSLWSLTRTGNGIVKERHDIAASLRAKSVFPVSRL